MTPLFTAALELQTFFDQRRWGFCIIGGVALLRWGRPRFTRDIDVSLLAGFGDEDRFIGPMLEAGYRPGTARVPPSNSRRRRFCEAEQGVVGPVC